MNPLLVKLRNYTPLVVLEVSTYSQQDTCGLSAARQESAIQNNKGQMTHNLTMTHDTMTCSNGTCEKIHTSVAAVPTKIAPCKVSPRLLFWATFPKKIPNRYYNPIEIRGESFRDGIFVGAHVHVRRLSSSIAQPQASCSNSTASLDFASTWPEEDPSGF